MPQTQDASLERHVEEVVGDSSLGSGDESWIKKFGRPG
jgi:hypothetical protein